MAKRRFLYVLTWLGCLFFYCVYQLWFSFILLIFVLLFPFLSLLLSLPSMLTAQLEIAPSPPVPTGTWLPLRVRCTSRFPVAAWRCRIRVERPLTGDSWLMKIGDYLPTENCGELVCTVEKGKVCDYLGLFSLPVRRTVPVRITVRPEQVTMSSLPAIRERLLQSWRPKPGGGFAENHELRLYRPGDSIRSIHWKLTAKTGQLILRESMEPIRNRVLLRLDLKGAPQELDRKLGRLLWLGAQLLELDISFEVQAMSGYGYECWKVGDIRDLLLALDALLGRRQALEGSVRSHPEHATWQYEIGGGPDEA